MPALPPRPLTIPEDSKYHPLTARSPLSVAFRHVRPMWRNYIEYVELAARNGDEEMARYRDCYLSLPLRDRRNHWPEQICELANVSPGELIGAVCRQLWESKAAESSMVSAMAHPEVLMATAQFARLPMGGRDRELFFRLTGSLPDKKGASINIINNPTAQAGIKVNGHISAQLKSMDEEVIEMSRELEAPEGAPFLVKDVPPEDH